MGTGYGKAGGNHKKLKLGINYKTYVRYKTEISRRTKVKRDAENLNQRVERRRMKLY